jgi:hypothetical protein
MLKCTCVAGNISIFRLEGNSAKVRDPQSPNSGSSKGSKAQEVSKPEKIRKENVPLVIWSSGQVTQMLSLMLLN